LFGNRDGATPVVRQQRPFGQAIETPTTRPLVTVPAFASPFAHDTTHVIGGGPNTSQWSMELEPIGDDPSGPRVPIVRRTIFTYCAWPWSDRSGVFDQFGLTLPPLQPDPPQPFRLFMYEQVLPLSSQPFLRLDDAPAPPKPLGRRMRWRGFRSTGIISPMPHPLIPTRPEDALIVVAHRGLHTDLPENSLEAMLAAWHAGVVWAELDIHMSRDGVPVVMHDSTLERTTTVKGAVNALTWAELREVRLLGKDKQPTACRVPSLQQVIEAMPKGAAVLIEVKPKAVGARELVKRAIELARGRIHAVQAFDRGNVAHAKEIDPEVPRGQLIGKAEEFEAGLESDAPVYMSFKIVDEERVGRLREMKRSWGVWTVNEPADMERMLAFKPDIFITDRPIEARRMIRDRGGK
jgi:glycerophosphoryl diester phosphodiesterase